MSSLPLRIVAVAAVTVVSVGAVAYLGTDDPPEQVFEVDVVVDPSASNGVDVCDDAEELARAVLRAGAGKRVVHLHRTSGRSRDGQPIRLGEASLSPAGSPLHGADERAADERRFVETIGRACRALPRTQESPIFAAIAAVFAQLNALPARPGLSRAAILVSDGVEEEDAELAAVQRGAAPTREARIDNRGVTTIVCGTANRAPHRGRLPAPEAIADGWRQQFTAPISVLPSCRGLEPLLRGGPSSPGRS